MPRPAARLRDWLFGATGKRRIIEILLADPNRSWKAAELARAAGLTPKGTVDEHLAALAQLGLVERAADGYRARREHELFLPLAGVLTALAAVPDADVDRPR